MNAFFFFRIIQTCKLEEIEISENRATEKNHAFIEITVRKVKKPTSKINNLKKKYLLHGNQINDPI